MRDGGWTQQSAADFEAPTCSGRSACSGPSGLEQGSGFEFDPYGVVRYDDGRGVATNAGFDLKYNLTPQLAGLFTYRPGLLGRADQPPECHRLALCAVRARDAPLLPGWNQHPRHLDLGRALIGQPPQVPGVILPTGEYRFANVDVGLARARPRAPVG